MTIYVDSLFEWPAFGYRFWFHMTTDQDDLSELHAMAQKIGIARRHFQNKAHFPHYDGTGRTWELAEKRRQYALALDAKEVTTTELVEMRRQRRAALREATDASTS